MQRANASATSEKAGFCHWGAREDQGRSDRFLPATRNAWEAPRDLREAFSFVSSASARKRRRP